MPGSNSRPNVLEGFEVPLSYWGDWLLLYIIINIFIVYLKCFCFVFIWYPYMAVNVSVQHNGGFLPGIKLLTQCYY